MTRWHSSSSISMFVRAIHQLYTASWVVNDDRLRGRPRSLDAAHILAHVTARSREDMWVILAALSGGEGLWVTAPPGHERNPFHVLVT